jgi:pyrimidine-specific ribonucleoside hydrolase
MERKYFWRLACIILIGFTISSCVLPALSKEPPTSLPITQTSEPPTATISILQTSESTTIPPTSTKEVSTKQKVIIDTDMAVDDWFAILYLLQNPKVDVVAITVTGTGEAHCDPGVQNAVGLVALAEYHPIPVTCGREIPLVGDHAFPDGWRADVDAMKGISLPEGNNPADAENVNELLATTLQISDTPVEVLTLGPLTNLADFISIHPELKEKISKITIMGGALAVPGNLISYVPDNTSAEWNIYVDPTAANIVLKSGISVTLVGLDVTNQVLLTPEFAQTIKQSAVTPEAKFVVEVLDKMQPFIDSGNWYFWDPLAAAIMVDPSLAAFQVTRIEVVEASGTDQGATVISSDFPEVQVAVTAKSDVFTQEFIETLNNQ